MIPSKKYPRRLATIQVDLDPLWFAFPSIPEFSFSQTENSIYASTVDSYLKLFEEYGVKATFFVVGRDLEKKIALDSIEKILAAGHEVANHTYTHASFNGGTYDEKIQDMENFAEIFGKNFNQTVSGFKAPCYAMDEQVMRYLDKRYLYDSSMISISVSSLLRLYYKKKRQYIHENNWGRLPHIFAPRVPYRCNLDKIWQRGESQIILLPVTSTPYVSLPFHFSFINIFGLKYFEWSYRLLRLSGQKYLNFAFHAIDLFDPPRSLDRPGISRPWAMRMDNARKVLERIVSDFTVYRSDALANLVKDIH